jgi:hypothetical protein
MEPRLGTREDHEHPEPEYVDATAGAEHLTWAQQSLRMREWIAAIAVLLCAFVTVLFLRHDAIPQAAAFGVIGLISLGYLGWTLAVKRRRNQR